MVYTRSNSDVKSTNNPDNEGNVVFFHDIKNFIKNLLEDHTKVLQEEIHNLRNEITTLKETNIDLIRLLTDKNNALDCNKNQSNLNTTVQSVDLNNTVVEQTRPKPNININKYTGNNKNEIEGKKPYDKNIQHTSTYKKTNKKRNEKKHIVGANKSENTDDNFGGGEPMLWLYVGRCKPETTTEKIRSYLEKKSPGHEFDVQQLSALGRFKSFRVGGNISLRNVVYDPSYWPNNVLVKRFEFRNSFRGRRDTSGQSPEF